MLQARHVHHDGREPSKSQLRSNQFVRRPPQHLFNLIQGKIGSVSLESGSTNVVFPSENKCFLHQIPLLSASIKTPSRLLFFTDPGVFKSLHENFLEMRRCWNVGEAEEAITRNFLSILTILTIQHWPGCEIPPLWPTPQRTRHTLLYCHTSCNAVIIESVKE